VCVLCAFTYTKAGLVKQVYSTAMPRL